jgi:hypothetical protein
MKQLAGGQACRQALRRGRLRRRQRRQLHHGPKAFFKALLGIGEVAHLGAVCVGVFERSEEPLGEGKPRQAQLVGEVAKGGIAAGGQGAVTLFLQSGEQGARVP